MKTIRFPVEVTVLGLAFLYFLWTTLSEIPIIQHEVIGLIYWWNSNTASFLQTLFDSSKMDSYPGRFRYVEYLAEAAYWKALIAGYLPRDLFDFFAIFTHAVTAILLLQIAKKQGVPKLARVLVIVLFLLSVPNYMVTRLHFRKAKSIVTLLFAIMAFATYLENRKASQFTLVLCFILGFFTDPFFITIAPILLLGLAWDRREKKFEIIKSLGFGILFSAFLWILLNGFIGPKFSSNSRLMAWGFEGKPATVLDFSAFPEFPRVLSELILPSTPYAHNFILGWVLTLVVLGAMFVWRNSSQTQIGLLASLLATTPIAAFLIRPLPERLAFSGYYGQPILVIVALALFQWLRNSLSTSTLAYRTSLVAIVGLICSHQVAIPSVYATWIHHQIIPQGAYEKVSREYLQLRALNTTLTSKEASPIAFPIGPRSFRTSLGSNLYYTSTNPAHPSDLVSILFPMLFRKEVQDGKLILTHSDAG